LGLKTHRLRSRKKGRSSLYTSCQERKRKNERMSQKDREKKGRRRKERDLDHRKKKKGRITGSEWKRCQGNAACPSNCAQSVRGSRRLHATLPGEGERKGRWVLTSQERFPLEKRRRSTSILRSGGNQKKKEGKGGGKHLRKKLGAHSSEP